MLACRAACSQPPNNGPTLHEARGPGLYIQLNHGPWRMEGREGMGGARPRARLEREGEGERGVRVEGSWARGATTWRPASSLEWSERRQRRRCNTTAA